MAFQLKVPHNDAGIFELHGMDLVVPSLIYREVLLDLRFRLPLSKEFIRLYSKVLEAKLSWFSLNYFLE